ncbi:mitochondrial carrier domain-containing protein [Mycena amicta]|nr:mitochondrial carrier domain-containing protein [Mycena amicta]
MGFVEHLVISALTAFIFTTVWLAIGMPFLGVLVRYRANYTPKRLQLPEDDRTPPSDDLVKSYFGILRRVYRVEGFAGLYKGIVPAILTALLAPLVQIPITIIAASFDAPIGPEAPLTLIILYSFVFDSLLPLVSALFLLPMQVLTYRAITTQHHLPFLTLSPKPALLALLSPAERRKPFLIYLAPGLALSNVLLALSAVIGLPVQMAVSLLLEQHEEEDPAERLRKHQAWLVIGGIVAIVFLGLLVTPLRLVRVRLALQRSESTSSAEESKEIADAPLILSEPVISLRNAPEHGHTPYTALVSCICQIVEEEGWDVVFRGCWIVALQLLWTMPAFVMSDVSLFTLLW